MCLSLALHVAWPLRAMPNKPNGDPVLLLREPRLVGAETHSPVGNQGLPGNPGNLAPDPNNPNHFLLWSML